MKCKQCNAQATIIDGEVHITCDCNAGIVAEISATVYGVGGTNL